MDLFGPREPATVEGQKCVFCGKAASFVRKNTLAPGDDSFRGVRRNTYWCGEHDDHRATKAQNREMNMSELTISQGLRQIKKLKGRMAETTSRAHASVSYKENAKPAFEFGPMMEQANQLRKELLDLTTKVRVTCAGTTIDFQGRKMTLTEAVAKLEDLKGEISWFRSLPVRPHAKTTETEWSYDSGQRVPVITTWTCDLPEATQAKKIMELQDDFDRLNDAVEKANHSTVLIKALA